MSKRLEAFAASSLPDRSARAPPLAEAPVVVGVNFHQEENDTVLTSTSAVCCFAWVPWPVQVRHASSP